MEKKMKYWFACFKKPKPKKKTIGEVVTLKGGIKTASADAKKPVKNRLDILRTEDKDNISVSSSCSQDSVLILEDTSEILSRKEIKRLSKELPFRLLCASWRKEFYSSRDGFSLSTLYRNLYEHADLSRPAMLIIRDMQGNRFGAFVSEAFSIHRVSYGCGETFVFRINKKKLQVWKWTGKNNLFIHCSVKSLCIGLDNGKFAISLDDGLDRGRTQACSTFDNELLTPSGDFHVASIEVWIFD